MSLGSIKRSKQDSKNQLWLPMAEVD